VTALTTTSTGDIATFTPDQARVLTDEVKGDAQALWRKLLALYEGGAHTALGYASWADYCAAEFDFGHRQSYRLLDAARVVDQIENNEYPVNDECPIGHSHVTESQARELTPLLRREPEAIPAAWEDARKMAASEGREITANDVRAAVDRRLPPPPIPAGVSLFDAEPVDEPEEATPVAAEILSSLHEERHAAVLRKCQDMKDYIERIERAFTGKLAPARFSEIELIELLQAVDGSLTCIQRANRIRLDVAGRP
jgi:hypothetical protein